MRRRAALFLILLALLLLTGAAGGEQSPFMFLHEIRPGMVGVGKTVVRGDRIEDFSVRIIDIIDNPGDLDDQIVVRVSGPAIAASGGIAAGMSGSPIYINGRLIGALWGAAEFDDSPEPLALVRPIAPMLTLLAALQPQHQQSGSAALTSIATGNGMLPPLDQQSSTIPVPAKTGTDTIYSFKPVATPVWVFGLRGRSLAQLRDGLAPQVLQENRKILLKLPTPLADASFTTMLTQGLAQRYNLLFYDPGITLRLPTGIAGGPASEPTKTADERLEPGSAIGVLLATGDVKIGALGTVTYRDKNLILGFGHQFLLRGPGELFLTAARIIDTVQSLQMPFKLGVPTEDLGAVLEDRLQGIAAILGTEPHSVKVNILVRDQRETARDASPEGGQHNRNFTVKLVADPDLLPVLLYAVVLNSIDTTLNRIGPGTLRVDYVFRGAGLPRRLERQDVFYSFTDIAPTAPLQIAQVAYLLAWNEFQDPQLDQIDIEITVSPRVKAYEILKLEADKETYKPGEQVNYTVTVKPFRGQEQQISGHLPLPENLHRKTTLTLHAFGGPRQESGEGDEPPKFASLDELISAIEDLESNDQLTVELLGLPATQTAAEKAEDISASTTPDVDVHKLSDWVIVGEEFTEIRVVPPQTASEKIESQEQQQKEPQQKEQQKPGSEGCGQLFYCD